tara:strand:- start:523 stop:849 length:327 start_codon:yes stop_codon:yes gene_type:complete
MIKNKQQLVQHFLESNPKTRDNDQLLCAFIWFDQLQYKIEGMTGKDLLKSYAKGDLVNADTISRCRQKLQQENPELRGKLYEKRHEKAKEVRKELGQTYLNYSHEEGR